MDANSSNKDDGRLSALLRTWQPGATLPPRFREQVWRRITHEGAPTGPPQWTNFWESLEAAFRRPALAVAYVAVLLVVGLSAGLAEARVKSSQVDQALETRYLQTVDPYLNAR
jgi:hypothetical protein